MQGGIGSAFSEGFDSTIHLHAVRGHDAFPAGVARGGHAGDESFESICDQTIYNMRIVNAGGRFVNWQATHERS